MPSRRKSKSPKGKRSADAIITEALRAMMLSEPLISREQIALRDLREDHVCQKQVKAEEPDEVVDEMAPQTTQGQTSGSSVISEKNVAITSASLPKPGEEINEEAVLEILKNLSLEDVCVHLARFTYMTADEGDSYTHSWFEKMRNLCLYAVEKFEYAPPQLPYELEQRLNRCCEEIERDDRAEKERNARKFERRNARHTIEKGEQFECVYTVDQEDLVSKPVLLTAISNDVEKFYEICRMTVCLESSGRCSSSCVCFSASRFGANVLHLAASHGNAEFIKAVLFPGEALPNERTFRHHYEIMLERWISGALSGGGAPMFPFDVAVYYNDIKCARALLEHRSTSVTLRNRQEDMGQLYTTYPFCSYTESNLSIAAYHGNLTMINILQEWHLIKKHHYPQAFRDAANAGDIRVIEELWEMCGKDETCLVEQPRKGKRMCSPLHLAAAAGHLNCVEFLCKIPMLHITPDAVGDLPLLHAVENGHLDVVDYLVREFPDDLSPNVIRAAIACQRNRVAKYLLQDRINNQSVVDLVKPMKYSVEVCNFHMAEYILKLYAKEKKITESPWSIDTSEALDEVLLCQSLEREKKVKFVIFFQLAGFKVSLVRVVKLVKDKALAATICNSLKHPQNQPKL